jgi:hypothetical protein
MEKTKRSKIATRDDDKRRFGGRTEGGAALVGGWSQVYCVSGCKSAVKEVASRCPQG